jgi:hypothetical protein
MDLVISWFMIASVIMDRGNIKLESLILAQNERWRQA